MKTINMNAMSLEEIINSEEMELSSYINFEKGIVETIENSNSAKLGEGYVRIPSVEVLAPHGNVLKKFFDEKDLSIPKGIFRSINHFLVENDLYHEFNEFRSKIAVAELQKWLEEQEIQLV